MDANSTPSSDNEIDLVELARNLWARKGIILLITLVFTGVAVGYAVLAKPVYRVQAAVVPPALSEIAGFNLGRNANIGLAPFNVDDVYRVFTRNLQSNQTKRRFYREVYLPSLSEDQKRGSQDAVYQKFLDTVTIVEPPPTQPGRFVLSIDHSDPEIGARWAGQYLADVEQRSVAEMIGNARSEIEVRGRNISQQIDSLRESARVRREDRALQLEEALSVASSIGLENPPVISGQMSDQLTAIMDGNLAYMRGAKALQAEIDALQHRKSDDPFVPELRGLQEQYALYASLKVDPERVAVFRMDGAIETPDAPVRPRKGLVIALGAGLGLIVSVFTALVLIAVRRPRKSVQGNK